MAKTSKTIPQKENASSSWTAGDKTPVEPCPEECVPEWGGVLTSDFKVEKTSSVLVLGQDAVMRPPSREEEVSPLAPKPAKDKKRKRVSTSKDPKPKKSKACKPKKDTVPLPTKVAQRLREEEEEDEDDDSKLVARVKKNTEAPKAAESVRVEDIQPRIEEVLEEGSSKVPESLETEDASCRNEQSVGMPEGAGSEALRNEVNAPSDSIGAIIIGYSLTLPTFSEEAIQEAQAMGTPDVEGAHRGEDLFHGCFIGVEDVADLIEASSLFDETEQALSRKIEELKARLAAELAKFKSEAEKAKAGVEAIVAVDQSDAEASQAQVRESVEATENRAFWIAELAKCQSRRETLKEIHARGFGLTDDIRKAKELEDDAKELTSSDNDDNAGSKSGSESGDGHDGEGAALENN
ncbi:uncharacterized protein [Nicotiana sylvestris]|uniref:uncharacterized protein n=1 Tax=Nicotiana sylvestris TaxID=4096 RepID=UPI00388CDD3C